MDGRTSPRTFTEKSKLSISLNQQSEIIYNFFFNCYLAAPRPTLGHY